MSRMAVVRAVVMVVLVLYGGYRAADLVLSAEALTVSRITVSGNTRMSRGEVLSLLDGLRGQSMVTLDIEAWREKLMASPWVSDAAIRRVLPGNIDVFISEREPMGIGRIGQSLYLIDRGGEVIDEFAVVDRSGRLQIPREMLEALDIGPRARLELSGDHVEVRPEAKPDDAARDTWGRR